jgi:hypothetical protein
MRDNHRSSSGRAQLPAAVALCFALVALAAGPAWAESLRDSVPAFDLTGGEIAHCVPSLPVGDKRARSLCPMLKRDAARSPESVPESFRRAYGIDEDDLQELKDALERGYFHSVRRYTRIALASADGERQNLCDEPMVHLGKWILVPMQQYSTSSWAAIGFRFGLCDLSRAYAWLAAMGIGFTALLIIGGSLRHRMIAVHAAGGVEDAPDP